MTKLSTEIQIDAPREKVWAVLADLEAVQYYDPAITKAYYTTDGRDGVGAARQCDFDGGYVRERVTEWKPGEGYAINAYEGSDVVAPFESQDARFTLRDAEQRCLLAGSPGGPMSSRWRQHRRGCGRRRGLV